MEKIVLNAERRTLIGKQVDVLRRAGKLPAVVYGFGVDPTPITLDLREATRVLTGLAPSALVNLNIEGKEYPTLVREKQIDYIRTTLRHVDFQAVSLTRKIRSTVPVILHGVSPAVKDFNGMVITNIAMIEVEALPRDLPDQFVIDISALDQIGSQVTVGDLQVPANVEVLTPAEEVVVHVTVVAEEKIEEEVAEELAEPEVIERGKREEEEEEE